MRRLFLSVLLSVALTVASLPAALSVTPTGVSVVPAVAHADAALKCSDGTQPANNDLSKCPGTGGITTQNCVKVGVKIGGKDCIDNAAGNGGAIVVYLRLVLQFLSGGIGLIIVLMLTIAGIQYIVSTGDPVQVKNAKNRIVNALTALVLFLLGFAIISFIVPGGVL
jgi:hypothetical protein